MVNIYGEKGNVDKEYGREGIRWVDVSNENVGESNSRNCNMAFALSLNKNSVSWVRAAKEETYWRTPVRENGKRCLVNSETEQDEWKGWRRAARTADIALVHCLMFRLFCVMVCFVLFLVVFVFIHTNFRYRFLYANTPYILIEFIFVFVFFFLSFLLLVPLFFFPFTVLISIKEEQNHFVCLFVFFLLFAFTFD